MTNPWSLPKKRSSFGGKNGVWWSAKGRRPRNNNNSNATTNDNGDNNGPTTTTTTKEEGIASKKRKSRQSTSPQVIGWDDDLCRPIYSVVPDACRSDDDDGDDDNDESSSLSGNDEPKKLSRKRAKSEKEEEEQKEEEDDNTPMVPAKRSGTFGDRGRRRLSMILLDAGVGHVCLPSPPPPKEDNRKIALKTLRKTALKSDHTNDDDADDEDYIDQPFSSSADHSGTEVTCSTTSPTSMASEASTATTILCSARDEMDGLEDLNFDAAEEESSSSPAAAAPKKKKRKKKKSDHLTPLRKAKEYFADLDATHKLTICNNDDNDGDKSSSRVIRTSYKPNLSSPRLAKEYEDYSEATRGLGVSPLPIAEYAKSRRDFFRKGELFDGFLDD